MKIKVTVVVVVICLFLTACGSQLTTETRGNDSVTGVSSEDAEMNKIIDEARETVDEFVAEFNDPNTKGLNFMVKYPFETDPGSEYGVEHIWLGDLEINDDKCYGIVANDPFYIENMKYGDKIEFDIHKVSDWQYIEDGYLVGGKSIVYFYDQMTDEEKAAFEDEAGFKIKE